MHEIFAQPEGGLVYVLPRGGRLFTKTFAKIDSECVAKLEECAVRWPLENTEIVKRIQEDIDKNPTTSRWLACETAFFNTLPKNASAYALPESLRLQDFRRFGADGLFHQSVADQYPGQRIVSVFLNEHPNAAAISNGKAVETSCGYSFLEGVAGQSTCGDLDPSVVLMLAENGLAPAKIEALLYQNSGWQAIIGSQCSFADLLTGQGEAFSLAREMHFQAVVKAIGAMVASLGGADRIVIDCESNTLCEEYVQSIRDRFAFSKIKVELVQMSRSQIVDFLFKHKGT